MTIEMAWENRNWVDFLRYDEQINHPIREMIASHGLGGSVIDTGCGTCIDYPLWHARGFAYTGLDFTPSFLNDAKILYPGINTVLADAADTGLPDRGFNTVFCKDLLEHLPPGRCEVVVWEMWRITDKRMMLGFFLAPTDALTEYGMVETGPHWMNCYNKADFIELLKRLPSANLTEIIEDIGYNHSALYIIDRLT